MSEIFFKTGKRHEEEGVAGHLERVRDHVARRPFKLPLRANPRGHLPKKRGRAVNKKGAKTKKETKKRETNKFLTFPTRRRTRPCPRNRTCCQTCTRTRPNPCRRTCPRPQTCKAGGQGGGRGAGWRTGRMIKVCEESGERKSEG